MKMGNSIYQKLSLVTLLCAVSACAVSIDQSGSASAGGDGTKVANPQTLELLFRSPDPGKPRFMAPHGRQQFQFCTTQYVPRLAAPALSLGGNIGALRGPATAFAFEEPVVVTIVLEGGVVYVSGGLKIPKGNYLGLDLLVEAAPESATCGKELKEASMVYSVGGEEYRSTGVAEWKFSGSLSIDANTRQIELSDEGLFSALEAGGSQPANGDYAALPKIIGSREGEAEVVR
ncbi:MAG: hypothetical protein AB7P04_10485 [Bacteriovoracia bacterium]